MAQQLAAGTPAPHPGFLYSAEEDLDTQVMLRTLSIRQHAIERRLELGDERMEKIEADLRANTESTQNIEKNTSDLVQAFNNWQGAKKTLVWAGSWASPLTKLIAFGSAVGGAVAAYFHWGPKQ